MRFPAFALILAALSATANVAAAEDPSFEGILHRHTRGALQAVAEYVQQNPEAEDVEAACRWAFGTADELGLEADAAGLAGWYVGRRDGSEEVRRTAYRIRATAHAIEGDAEAALSDFEAYTKTLRIRGAGDALDTATELAAHLQVSGKPDALPRVYDTLRRGFFLSDFVRQATEDRLSRLELAGRKAPEISLKDLAGKAIDLSDYEGKVVLVDFWATNCAPCLEEFPRFRKLLRDHGGEGFAIVGISLDDNARIVEAAREQLGMDWRLALSSQDEGATRERYKARKIPCLFLLDRNGKVAFVDVRGTALDRAVEALLESDGDSE